MSLTFGPQILLTRTTFTRDEKSGELKESRFRVAGERRRMGTDQGTLMMLAHARERFLSWVGVPCRNAWPKAHNRRQICSIRADAATSTRHAVMGFRDTFARDRA
jgi:hypothetical protein